MDIERDFGTIRSLLHTPSSRHWKLLSGVVDRYRDHWDHPFFQEQVLPYLHGKLAAWPTQLWRFAQHTWLHESMTARHAPQLQLANAIHLVGHELDARRLAKLFDSPHLGAMRYIDLSSKVVGEALVHLLGSESLADIEILDLSRAGLNGVAVDLLAQSPTMSTLRKLDLSHNSLRDVRGFAESEQLSALSELSLRGSRLSCSMLLRLMRVWSLPALRRLDVRQNRLGPLFYNSEHKVLRELLPEGCEVLTDGAT